MASTLGYSNTHPLYTSLKTFCCDIQNIIFHIECEMLINPDLVPAECITCNNTVLVFAQQLPENEILYQLTCRKLSSEFTCQFLNKLLHNINFEQFSQPEYSEFSENDKKILKSYLREKLAYHLAQNGEQTFSYPSFVHYYNVYNDRVSLGFHQSENNNDNSNQGKLGVNLQKLDQLKIELMQLIIFIL